MNKNDKITENTILPEDNPFLFDIIDSVKINIRYSNIAIDTKVTVDESEVVNTNKRTKVPIEYESTWFIKLYFSIAYIASLNLSIRAAMLLDLISEFNNNIICKDCVVTLQTSYAAELLEVHKDTVQLVIKELIDKDLLIKTTKKNTYYIHPNLTREDRLPLLKKYQNKINKLNK